LVVISSDLSHYLDYREAQTRDAETTRAIEALEPERLDLESACGRIPAGGLLLTAKRKQLAVHTLDVRNSGDTQGGRDRVVGYGAWAFVEDASRVVTDETDEAEYGPEERERLLELARYAITYSQTHGDGPSIRADDYPAKLGEVRACFVTLHLRGELRGCIGNIEAMQPLAVEVAGRARATAYHDPRFDPVRREELDQLEISISVLSAPESFSVASEEELLSTLRPGIDGLILQEVTSRGVFLPAVWEQLPDPREFVEHLKVKAGLGEKYWSNSIQLWRFATESFGDGARE
jgi:AmmeMemoRadiSam system protein A